jgi:hypothetical protein
MENPSFISKHVQQRLQVVIFPSHLTKSWMKGCGALCEEMSLLWAMFMYYQLKSMGKIAPHKVTEQTPDYVNCKNMLALKMGCIISKLKIFSF